MEIAMARQMKPTLTQMFNEMTSRWSPFPNTNPTLGAYDYFSQTISLNSIDLGKLEAATRDKEFSAQFDVFPLLTHEMQHLVDHTTSVWGRDLLVRLFDVYAVRDSCKSAEFWRISEMMRELKTAQYSDYYTEYTDIAFEPWNGNPWRCQFSTGVQLDGTGRENESRPIVFTRFFRNDDGAFICRVPVCVSSLLEVRAIAAEMVASIGMLGSDGDNSERVVYKNLWSNRMQGMLYDATLTRYTVAAHCFANRFEVTDMIQAYCKASHVAWLCLNLPRQFFSTLRIPAVFHEWGKRNEALRDNADRGYLYLALIENGCGLETRDMDAWLDEALERSSLPSLDVVLKKVEAEREALAVKLDQNPYRQRLEDLFSLGRDFARQEHQSPGKTHLLGSAPIPPFLLSNGVFAGVTGSPNTGTFANPRGWFENAFRIYGRMKEFVDACIF